MISSNDQSRRVLGAILLNPPLTTGAATMRHLQVAAELLGCDDVRIANLFAIPTASVTEINEVGTAAKGWKAAQVDLRALLGQADHLLAGWGVSGLVGSAARHRTRQLVWLGTRAQTIGQHTIWTLNGEPRHPSRWHQYVSDRHGRATGNSLHDRLDSVLRSVLITTLCPSPQSIIQAK
jgi:hypothetical protein